MATRECKLANDFEHNLTIKSFQKVYNRSLRRNELIGIYAVLRHLLAILFHTYHFSRCIS